MPSYGMKRMPSIVHRNTIILVGTNQSVKGDYLGYIVCLHLSLGFLFAFKCKAIAWDPIWFLLTKVKKAHKGMLISCGSELV